MSRFKSFDRFSYREGVQRSPRQKQARWIKIAVKELSRGQKLSQSIHLAIERCRDCEKKQLKSSIDKLGIERCRGAVEIP